MLDPEQAGASLRNHFDTVTDEEFIANVKQFNPDLAQELWGDRPLTEICGAPSRPTGRTRSFFTAFGRSVLRLFS